MNHKFLVVIILLFCHLGFGQVNFEGKRQFCNEWINPNQSYYKFTVSEDGIYKISAQDLVTNKIDLNSFEGKQIKLIRNGKQIPIYVSNQGTLTTADYILFAGKKNRSEFDIPLFKSEEELLNPAYSMFTDKAAYFLTWDPSIPPVNIQLITNELTDTVPREKYYFHQSEIVFQNELNKRGQGFDHKLKYPKFDVGQGYSTSPFAEKTIALEFPHWFKSTESTILQAYFGGYGEDGTRHKAEFYIDEQLKSFASFIGFKVKKGELSIPEYDMKSSINLKIKANGSPGESIVLSYVNYTYTRDFDFDFVKSAKINVTASTIKKHFIINNFDGGDAIVVMDINNNLFLRAARNLNGSYSFQLPESNKERTIYLYNEQHIHSIKEMSSIKTESITNENIDYLILSHSKLLNDANQYVQEYANYRRSIEGGAYKVKVVDVNNLYDQFSFGIQGHSQALRNYFNYIKTFYPNLKHVFIIAKGLEIQNYRQDAQAESTYHLVPTYGVPGSDPLLVTDENDQQLYSLGRLPVIDPKEIHSYLNKIKEHEYYVNNQATEHENMQWNKRIIHLAGGDPLLYTTLETSLNNMRSIIEHNQFGASVKTFHKENAGSLQGESITDLLSMIDEGVSLISYLGHSAQFKLDFNITNAKTFSNKGRYHTFLAMGCFAGQIFATSRSISEEHNLVAEKGSIVYLSNSTAGIPYVLGVYGDEFYRALGGSYYGKTLGETIKATNNIILTSTDEFVRTQALSLTYNGDPAFRMNVLKGQDFMPIKGSLTTKVKSIFAEDKSFDVKLDIMNLGVNYNDSLEIEFKMKLPSGEIKTVLQTKILSPQYNATYAFTLPLFDKSSIGINRIYVTVDPADKISEFPNPVAEKNNQLLNQNGEIGVEVNIFGNKAKPMSPCNYDIVTNNQPTLTAYNAITLAGVTNYRFEIDTTALFNSPLKQQKTITQTGGTISWPTKLNLIPGAVYYWRVASEQSNNAPLAWENSSFIYLPNSADGVNQSHYFQFAENTYNNLKIENQRRQFSFTEDLVEFRIANGYIELPSYIRPRIFHGDDYIMDYKYWNYFSNLSGIIVSYFNMQTGSLVRNATGTDYNSFGDTRNAGQPFFIWKTDTRDQRARLMDFLSNTIPSGTVVIIQTLIQYQYSLHTEEWESDGTNNLFSLLNSYGANEFIQLKQLGSVPYNFVFKKGDKSFVPKENVGNLNSESELIHSFYVNKEKGSMQSAIFGPASSWDKMIWNHTTPNALEDLHSVSIIGVKSNGDEIVLYKDVNALNQDLSTVSASEFPRIKLVWNSKDESSRTSAQLNYWRILYKGLPDLAISPALGYTQNKLKLKPGEQLQIEMPVSNISKYDSKPVLVRFTTVHPNGVKVSKTERFTLVASNGRINVPYKFKSLFTAGKFQVIIELNPNADQEESDYSNNIAIIGFEVLARTTEEAVAIANGEKENFGNEKIESRSVESSSQQPNAEFRPNPTNGFGNLNIVLNNESKETEWSLQILDIAGREVYQKALALESKSKLSIPIEIPINLENGSYFYRIRNTQAKLSSDWNKLAIAR